MRTDAAPAAVPVAPVMSPVMAVSASGVLLRQPHERPAVVKVAKDRPTSFWVGCDRQQLNARIAEHQADMRNSKMARLIDGAVRNY